MYGGDNRVDAITNEVCDGEKIQIGQLKVNCMFTPCHTSGHICYFIKPDNDSGAVFTGLIFSGFLNCNIFVQNFFIRV